MNNVGRNHPVVARVAEGLARTGAAVLVPDSRTLLEGRLEAGEIDGVVRAFETLAARPEVDPARVAIAGFSVGGSLALLAARDPRIAAGVRWVNAFGAYADARTYLASVSAHAHLGAEGAAVPWEPSPLAREVYLRFMLDQVSDADDRAALADAFGAAIAAGGRPAPDPDLRASAGHRCRARRPRPAHGVGARGGDRARSTGSRPRAWTSSTRSRRFATSTAWRPTCSSCMRRPTTTCRSSSRGRLLPPSSRLGVVRTFSEFRLFDHVQPDDLDLVAAAPELVRLLLHVRTLMEETL